VEPVWNRLLERAAGGRGYEATINGNRIRLVYEHGARYEKAGYEPVVHQAVMEALTPGAVVFDVGAHIGILALSAAQRVGPTGRVVAFEAAARTARTLRRHVAMNGLEDRVQVVEAVVSDREGESEFHVYGESMAASIAPGALALSPEPTAGATERTIVRAVTIDGMANRLRIRPDLVKIDVEGAELLVLRGMPSLLADPAVSVLCEIHPRHLAAHGASVDEVKALVEATGRRLEVIDSPNTKGIYHTRLTPR
jgi:FkbM family methyltransferase